MTLALTRPTCTSTHFDVNSPPSIPSRTCDLSQRRPSTPRRRFRLPRRPRAILIHGFPDIRYSGHNKSKRSPRRLSVIVQGQRRLQPQQQTSRRRKLRYINLTPTSSLSPPTQTKKILLAGQDWAPPSLGASLSSTTRVPSSPSESPSHQSHCAATSQQTSPTPPQLVHVLSNFFSSRSRFTILNYRLGVRFLSPLQAPQYVSPKTSPNTAPPVATTSSHLHDQRYRAAFRFRTKIRRLHRSKSPPASSGAKRDAFSSRTWAHDSSAIATPPKLLHPRQKTLTGSSTKNPHAFRTPSIFFRTARKL